MRESYIDTLIANWVRDELTEDESAEFEAWCNKNPEVFDELRELKEVWHRYGRFELKGRSGDCIETWSRIAERIRKE